MCETYKKMMQIIMLALNAFALPLVTCFDVICDNNEDFFLKTYLHFLMMQQHVNNAMILHIQKINFLCEMFLHLIKTDLI